jgi:hypothetical protein
VTHIDLGQFSIPQTFDDHYFLINVELRAADGRLVSRSVYWPRCPRVMADPQFRVEYRKTRHPALSFHLGPSLEMDVSKTKTTLRATLVAKTTLQTERTRFDCL